MMEFGKRLRDGTRRDSGYSLKEDSESESASPDKVTTTTVAKKSCPIFLVYYYSLYKNRQNFLDKFFRHVLVLFK